MSDFDERFAGLKARFAARAGQEADMLEALSAANDWSGIRDIAHGLSGRAGMFGYGGLGDVARAVEEAIDDGAEPRETLASLIARLRRLDQER